MKGWAWVAVAVFLAASTGLGLLPEGREMEELSLITALAADAGEDGVSVTALTGVRASENETAETLTGRGATMAAACEDMRGGQASLAYLGQAERLLLGEEMARHGLEEALDFVLTGGELRLDTSLYIVAGAAAGEGLTASAEAAAETPGEDKRGRTAGETMTRLAEDGCALVPALTAGEDGSLIPAGWAALTPTGLAGYLTGDAARGAELLFGMGKGEVISLPEGAVELTSVRLYVKRGTVCCHMEARGEVRAEVLEAWGTRCIRAALDTGWDGWSLNRRQAALCPWDREELKHFPVAGFKVEVTGEVTKSYGARD